METPLVQSAGAPAPPPSVSPGLDGAPTLGDSFAVTLGRALGTVATLTQDVPSSDPKITPREKSASADKSSGDSSTASGLLLGCVFPNLVQPAPTLATGIAAKELAADPEGPATAALSPSEAIAQPSEGKASKSAGTASTLAALASLAALNAFSGMVGGTVLAMGKASSEGLGSALHNSGRIVINGSDRAGSAPPAGPAKAAPAYAAEIHELSAPAMAVGQQAARVPPLPPTVGLQSQSEPAPNQGPQTSSSAALPSSRPKEQGPAPAQGTTPPTSTQGLQTSASATRFSAQPEQSGSVQAQGTTPPTSTQGLQTSASPTLFSSQPEQSGSVQAQESTQLPAIQGLQSSVTSPPPSSQQTQSGTVSAAETTEPVNSDWAEVSSLLAEFAGVEVNLKVTGTESKSAGLTEKPTSASSPLATDPARGGPLEASAGSPQIQLFTGLDNLVHSPAKAVAPSGQIPGSSILETAPQKVTNLEPARLGDPVPATTGTTPTQHLDTSSPLAATGTGLQKEAAAEANTEQPSSASPSTTSGATANVNLSDQATNDEEKQGQQRGPSTDETSTANKPFSSELSSPATLGSTTNLLTPQASESPASHPNTSTPQPPPPAGQPPATLAAWQNYEGSAGGIVRSARLSDDAGGAEMHVELRSGILGPLEVHAVLREGSVGAEIRVEGGEAHTLLAAGLPSLERALGDRNLRVENLAIYQNHSGDGMSGGEKQDPHSNSAYSPQREVVHGETLSQPNRLPRDTVEIGELGNPVVGLSVHA